jgi:DNA-binding CsgD family transcriptional regulator
VALESLTPSELSVLRLMAQGMNGKEIARDRATTVNTVYSQIKSIQRKLGTNHQLKSVALYHQETLCPQCKYRLRYAT